MDACVCVCVCEHKTYRIMHSTSALHSPGRQGFVPLLGRFLLLNCGLVLIREA